MKKITTDFCKDKFNKFFIKSYYNYFYKIQLNLVRLLGFEPRTSWSVAKRSIQLSYRRNIKIFFNLIFIRVIKL